MNTIINIALIVIVLAGAAWFWQLAAYMFANKHKAAWVAAVTSFICLFISILAIGQYID